MALSPRARATPFLERECSGRTRKCDGKQHKVPVTESTVICYCTCREPPCDLQATGIDGMPCCPCLEGSSPSASACDRLRTRPQESILNVEDSILDGYWDAGSTTDTAAVAVRRFNCFTFWPRPRGLTTLLSLRVQRSIVLPALALALSCKLSSHGWGSLRKTRARPRRSRTRSG